MIISASYKTDIPAFYTPWFLNRLAAGFCKTVNPYGGQVYRILLDPENVDGFVFWTRDVAPFWPALEKVKKRGHPFVVQYTLTGYPAALEEHIPPPEEALGSIKKISQTYGIKTVVWRYDPILLSTLTPVEFHLNNFARLAKVLKGHVDEVVVSWAYIYRKSARNLDSAAARHGFAWEDPAAGQKKELLGRLAEIAKACGMKLSLCCQRELAVPGTEDGACIDPRRLSEVAGHEILAKAKGHRPGCGCAQSKDIGAYDTCVGGCVDRYAVNGPEVAVKKHAQHDPEGEFLFGTE